MPPMRRSLCIDIAMLVILEDDLNRQNRSLNGDGSQREHCGPDEQ